MSDELPELPEYLFHHKRHNIVKDISVVEIFKDCPETMKVFGRQLIAVGWTFTVVEQTRGRCYWKIKTITIPLWIIHKGNASRQRWYIAHEMAHAFNFVNKTNDIHGPNFMNWLKQICPLEDQHWEYGYKPRNAASAGLSQAGKL